MSLGKTRWLNAGSPRLGVMTPIVQLKALLNRYGYEVGTVGDKRHMDADVAEDHTWYSQTGWPSPALLGWCYAGDIMAPPAGRGLPSLVELAGQICSDWAAGVNGTQWIKYVNRERADGSCIHEARDPNHRIVSSNDRGHIHCSGRVDFRSSTIVADSGWDPVERARGGVIAPVHTPTDTGFPQFGGRTLVQRRPMMHGADVLTGQQRLAERGWRITADGWYGAQSAEVVRKFQADSTAHGWHLSADSQLGPLTWRALWLRPKT